MIRLPWKATLSICLRSKKGKTTAKFQSLKRVLIEVSGRSRNGPLPWQWQLLTSHFDFVRVHHHGIALSDPPWTQCCCHVDIYETKHAHTSTPARRLYPHHEANMNVCTPFATTDFWTYFAPLADHSFVLSFDRSLHRSIDSSFVGSKIINDLTSSSWWTASSVRGFGRIKRKKAPG